MILTVWWCTLIWLSEGAVLDPALYLAPSPPLTPASDDLTAEDMWQKRSERDLDILAVVPIMAKFKTTPLNTSPSPPLKLTTPSETTTPLSTTTTTTTEAQEFMDKAETLWPRLQPYFGSIHIPLTFSLTGNYGGGYGRYGTGSGVIGSSYVSVNDDSGIYGKTGLAGSSYGIYGTRVYGGNNGPGWSGWGNGKWGHYGTG